MALNIELLPNDSKQLSGYEGYYRVDNGKYRIVYKYSTDDDLVEVILVGKRNDDVYKRLKQLLR